MNDIDPTTYILIADDDVDDIEMLTTALSGLKKDVHVVVVHNGQEVLEQLKTVQDKSAGSPCVLVMDMNMPKMDGRETVVALKTNTAFKNLPLLLFSTSKNKTDEMFAEKWNVQYAQKPDTVQGLDEVAETIINMCQIRP